MKQQVWLNVPYEQKDEAKAAGALWDGERGRWWAPEGSAASGDGRWVPAPSVWPDPLPGEDRDFAGGLSIDLVPVIAWFTNVRTAVTRRTWEGLRLYVFERADRCCEGCGSWEHTASGRALELHERFEFDVPTRTQSLRRLVALCERCHAVAHFDRTVSQGFEREEFAHLLRVTGMTAAEATACVDDARTATESRGRYEWEPGPVNPDLRRHHGASVDPGRVPARRSGPPPGEWAALIHAPSASPSGGPSVATGHRRGRMITGTIGRRSGRGQGRGRMVGPSVPE